RSTSSLSAPVGSELFWTAGIPARIFFLRLEPPCDACPTERLSGVLSEVARGLRGYWPGGSSLKVALPVAARLPASSTMRPSQKTLRRLPHIPLPLHTRAPRRRYG